EAPLCNCGKRGCLEAIVANYGVVRAATGEERVPSDKTLIATLVEQARSGDERVQAVFQRAGVALGTAVANLVNIFDPGRVLIGGEGLRAGDLILKSMRDTISLHTLGPPREDISVVVQMEDEVTWARGAASLILRELFQPPIYENQEGLVIQDLLSRATQKRTRKG
ncbi:MAG TPA: ROK family protein, partial [Ktedonobacteraceae bacterium]|nr:ROK family protein [Ktedonobacteraceae bacterium]